MLATISLEPRLSILDFVLQKNRTAEKNLENFFSPKTLDKIWNRKPGIEARLHIRGFLFLYVPNTLHVSLSGPGLGNTRAKLLSATRSVQ